MIFVLDQGGQHQYGYCRINSFCVILYLTTVISTVRITEKSLRFCNFCAWPSWSALLGLLKNHFFCVILYLTKVDSTNRVAAELIRFCDFILD